MNNKKRKRTFVVVDEDSEEEEEEEVVFIGYKEDQQEKLLSKNKTNDQKLSRKKISPMKKEKSSLQEEEESETCAICLCDLVNLNNNNSNDEHFPKDVDKTTTVASLPTCSHQFHLECIETWSNMSATCPCCKVNFEKIIYHRGKQRRVTHVEPKPAVNDDSEEDSFIDDDDDEEYEEEDDDGTCHICSEPEYVNFHDATDLSGELLICDGFDGNYCDACVHRFCVGEGNDEYVTWVCSECLKKREEKVALEIAAKAQKREKAKKAWTDNSKRTSVNLNNIISSSRQVQLSGTSSTFQIRSLQSEQRTSSGTNNSSSDVAPFSRNDNSSKHSNNYWLTREHAKGSSSNIIIPRQRSNQNSVERITVVESSRQSNSIKSYMRSRTTKLASPISRQQSQNQDGFNSKRLTSLLKIQNLRAQNSAQDHQRAHSRSRKKRTSLLAQEIERELVK